jgi:hypothetical protein
MIRRKARKRLVRVGCPRPALTGPNPKGVSVSYDPLRGKRGQVISIVGVTASRQAPAACGLEGRSRDCHEVREVKFDLRVFWKRCFLSFDPIDILYDECPALLWPKLPGLDIRKRWKREVWKESALVFVHAGLFGGYLALHSPKLERGICYNTVFNSYLDFDCSGEMGRPSGSGI